ncbi:hypothetical protein [Streptomyces sp. 2231.1]|uniref:hypothetical protein n=1 Tax=Streptomyces sp. 2231.1 TaxID=1855347 RepID=UPI00115FA4CB|nr:hypothetical protein [Streptomyces sp. 2231.1]
MAVDQILERLLSGVRSDAGKGRGKVLGDAAVDEYGLVPDRQEHPGVDQQVVYDRPPAIDAWEVVGRLFDPLCGDVG